MKNSGVRQVERQDVRSDTFETVPSQIKRDAAPVRTAGSPARPLHGGHPQKNETNAWYTTAAEEQDRPVFLFIAEVNLSIQCSAAPPKFTDIFTKQLHEFCLYTVKICQMYSKTLTACCSCQNFTVKKYGSNICRFYGFTFKYRNLINWYNVNIPTYWSAEICFVSLKYTDKHQKQVVMKKSHDEPKPITSCFWILIYTEGAQRRSHKH